MAAYPSLLEPENQAQPGVQDQRLLIDPLPAPGPAAGAPTAALRRALSALQAARPRYDLWRALLEAAEPYGPALGRMERFVREQWLSNCLVEARDAAAGFLAAAVDRYPEEVAEALESAAEHAAQLATLAEDLLVPPDAIHRAHLPEDLDWRQRRRDLLATLAAAEDQLRVLLRRALLAAGEAM